MAVNKDAIIDAVYQGAGKKAKNPIPPTIWSYNDKVEDTTTIRKRPASCWRRPASPTGSKPTCGPCRCSGPTIPTPAAWRR